MTVRTTQTPFGGWDESPTDFTRHAAPPMVSESRDDCDQDLPGGRVPAATLLPGLCSRSQRRPSSRRRGPQYNHYRRHDESQDTVPSSWTRPNTGTSCTPRVNVTPALRSTTHSSPDWSVWTKKSSITKWRWPNVKSNWIYLSSSATSSCSTRSYVWMLEFYYDFMDKYVDRSDFEYCEIDTDSAYMAISGSCLEDVICPDMQNQYKHGLKGFCTDSDIEADACFHWFPRTCCVKHAKYDKRTPGLFKLEYQGDEMIGLCSKTYIVRKSKVVSPSSARVVARRLLTKAKGQNTALKRLQSRRTQEYKFSSKGVSKRHLHAPMTKFRRVLRTRTAEGGLNRGFRVRNNAVFTYVQERRGFSYLYCKRQVLNDGIHTKPLDITLCPLKPSEREVNDQELIDLLASNFDD